MAKAATAKKPTPQTPEQAAADRPLLDLNNDKVKKMIKVAKRKNAAS